MPKTRTSSELVDLETTDDRLTSILLVPRNGTAGLLSVEEDSSSRLETTLAAMGLLPADGVAPQTIERQPRGYYQSLQRLGATIIDVDSDTADNMRQELHGALNDEFVVVKNFPLELPESVVLGAGDDDPDESDAPFAWPEESGIAEAHSSGIRGDGILIGILDTGIDHAHPELAGQQIVTKYIGRDDQGADANGAPGDHGTHICGIIAGKEIGVAPQARVFAGTVFDPPAYRTSIDRVVRGLEWLLTEFSREEHEDKPGIVNLSLGFPAVASGGDEYTKRVASINAICERLMELKIPTFAAIGNRPDRFMYPGGLGCVAGVGAVTLEKTLCAFSGSGENKPDLLGFGEAIRSSVVSGDDGARYARMRGTSQASAYVTGIAALDCACSSEPSYNVVQRLVEKAMPAANEVDRSIRIARFTPSA